MIEVWCNFHGYLEPERGSIHGFWKSLKAFMDYMWAYRVIDDLEIQVADPIKYATWSRQLINAEVCLYEE
jgi:hypothetical protein